MTDGRHTLPYRLGKDDFAAFEAFHARGNGRKPFPAPVRWTLGLVVLGGLAWFLWQQASVQGSFGMIASVALFLVLAGVIGIMLFQSHFRLKRQMEDPTFHHDMVAAISPDGISLKSPVVDSTTAWSVIHKVSASHDLILVYLSLNHAILVPKRAFATPGDADLFLAQAEAYKAKALTAETRGS